MDTSSKQSHESPAPAGRQQALMQRVRQKGRELAAGLGAFLTRRQHARGGLYLPLVRIDRGD